jgi:hypothetical protein
MTRRRVVVLALAGCAAAFVVWYVADQPLDATTPGEVCEVHGTPLVEDIVPIVYGLPARLTPAEGDFVHANFPCARTDCGGGCVVGSKTKARVSYCPDCRRARAEWEASHGKHE